MQTKTSSTSEQVLVLTDSSSGQTIRIESQNTQPKRNRGGISSKKLENAIYAYIQAMRSLGRARINTDDIAEALAVSVKEVNRALSGLRRKGIKPLNA